METIRSPDGLHRTAGQAAWGRSLVAIILWPSKSSAAFHWVPPLIIPLRSESMDTLTIAFGIRNVTHIEAALAEILRVLRPGGRFLCLEFSKPWAPIRPFYEFSRVR